VRSWCAERGTGLVPRALKVCVAAKQNACGKRAAGGLAYGSALCTQQNVEGPNSGEASGWESSELMR